VTAPSPALNASKPLALILTSDGETVDSDRILSIDIWNEANRIPRARLVLKDGQAEAERFPLSRSDRFEPGKRIEIMAGYGSESEIVHSGVVIRHSLKIVPDATPQLIVETADPLLKMTLSRNSALSAQTTDKALISALVAAGGGTVGANEAKASEHEALIQFHSSDWDLMLLRAEASGCLVYVDDAKVDVVAPKLKAPVLALEYGDDIIAFDATVDAPSQIAAGAAKSRSWSHAEQALKEAGGSAPSLEGPGNFSSATLAKSFSVATAMQQSGAAIDDARLGEWSTAALLRAALARVQGTAKFQGSPLVRPGTTVTLSGMGERFDGDAYVTGVRHHLQESRWLTTATFGLGGDGFASRNADVGAAPAAGLAPPARGLHTGTVTQVAVDPQGDFRIKVSLPLVDAGSSLWARLGHGYASSGFGSNFHPEIGDEVVLGFMDEDPSSPVVLASLYSRTRAPAYAADEQNNKKAIVTRSMMEITFDDTDVVLELKTPGGRLVRLDDKAKTVTITDPFANKIVMSEASVEIVSAKEMRLTSGTDMKVDCGGSLKVEAKVDYALDAQQITATAAAKLALVSKAVGELKAAAPLTIAGAIVKIN
jgi:Rhs element Vgr protein